jgi:hypothetical protein
MKEWLHIIISAEKRQIGDDPVKKPVWVIDIYRTQTSRLRMKSKAEPQPIDTLEITEPYILVVQPGGFYQLFSLDEAVGYAEKVIRTPLPLKAPFHIYGIYNTPAIVSGEEDQE